MHGIRKCLAAAALIFGLQFLVLSEASVKSEKPTSGGTNKPKFSAPKPAAPAPKPTNGIDPKPKFGPPASKGDNALPKKPREADGVIKPKKPVGVDGSTKPKTGSISSKAQVAKEASSERKFKETYKTPNGKEVKIRAASPHVEKIRTMPANNFNPEARKKTVSHHVHHHHYSRPYDWYCGQPVVYVGGGYSSAFWWMMMTDWDAERRARWLYHNQQNIERDAYERGMRDAAVAHHISKLKANGVRPNNDYVDPEFENDPTVMYDDEFLREARHSEPNHVVREHDESGAGTVLTWFIIIIIIGVVAYLLVYKVRWGS